MIHMNNVTKEYVNPAGERIAVLRNISLEIPSNTSVAIKGPSGSGKSTLLSLLAGLEKPTSGEILVNNALLTSYDENALALFRSKSLGFVFQQFHLLPHFSALQNVVIAAEIGGIPNPKERAAQCLERVGLGHRLSHLPSKLSGGECQRVALARAIVTRPEILLCDEPTGSLDTENAEKVAQLLLELQKELKSILVLVTHDPALAYRMEYLLEIERGELKTMKKNNKDSRLCGL